VIDIFSTYIRHCDFEDPMTDPVPVDETLAMSPAFLHQLGVFHGAWSSAEQAVDFAIGQLLKLSYEQTHLLTAGMMFGSKARLLSALVKRSARKDTQQLLQALNLLRSEIKRDWLAHSYIVADRQTVTFINRSAANEYSVNSIRFSLTEFSEHILALTEAAGMIHRAFFNSKDELYKFIAAIDSAKNKSPTPAGDG
jgi:hypothetical protein